MKLLKLKLEYWKSKIELQRLMIDELKDIIKDMKK